MNEPEEGHPAERGIDPPEGRALAERPAPRPSGEEETGQHRCGGYPRRQALGRRGEARPRDRVVHRVVEQEHAEHDRERHRAHLVDGHPYACQHDDRARDALPPGDGPDRQDDEQHEHRQRPTGDEARAEAAPQVREALDVRLDDVAGLVRAAKVAVDESMEPVPVRIDERDERGQGSGGEPPAPLVLRAPVVERRDQDEHHAEREAPVGVRPHELEPDGRCGARDAPARAHGDGDHPGDEEERDERGARRQEQVAARENDDAAQPARRRRPALPEHVGEQEKEQRGRAPHAEQGEERRPDHARALEEQEAEEALVHDPGVGAVRERVAVDVRHGVGPHDVPTHGGNPEDVRVGDAEVAHRPGKVREEGRDDGRHDGGLPQAREAQLPSRATGEAARLAHIPRMTHP